MGYFEMMFNANGYEHTGAAYKVYDKKNMKTYYDEIEDNVFYGKKIGEKSIWCELDEDGIHTDWIGIYDFILSPCISIRFKELLEQFNIGNCEFIPIYDKNSNVIIGYLLNVLNVFNKKCLNVKNTKFTFIGFRKDVIRPAFNEEVINDLDIFSYKYMKDDNKRGIFISERLKRAMKKAKITGCSFVYCESFK